MEITYTNHDGFYLPNLTLPRKEEAPFGRYAISFHQIRASAHFTS